MSSPVAPSTYDVFGVNDLPPRPVRTTEGDAAPAKAGNPLFGKDGFTFGDFLDIINPLQHIPIVNTVYRAITGDQIDPGARIIGGGLFGGPIGLAASLISGAVEEATGKDPGEHALAALGIDLGTGGKDEPQTMLAAADTSSAETQTAPVQTLAQSQSQTMPEMKLGVGMDPRAGDRKPPAKRDEQAVATSGGAIELPADLFQALKQTAAAQQAEARSDAVNTVRANPLPGESRQPHTAGPMQINAGPGQAIQTADGRTWFPAHPKGGGVATRGVGTSPVTQANATLKFGTVRGNNYLATPQSATASTAAMLQGERQNEWSTRAADAYQKYFEMQNEKNRRAGIVP